MAGEKLQLQGGKVLNNTGSPRGQGQEKYEACLLNKLAL